MQKPIDTTQRINQLLLRASKPLNTLGERKGVHNGGGGGGVRKQQGQTVRRGGTNAAMREGDDEIERGECGVKRKAWRDGWRQREGSYR